MKDYHFKRRGADGIKPRVVLPAPRPNRPSIRVIDASLPPEALRHLSPFAVLMRRYRGLKRGGIPLATRETRKAREAVCRACPHAREFYGHHAVNCPRCPCSRRMVDFWKANNTCPLIPSRWVQ